MVVRKSWFEFKDSGLLWWINMILHTFGWAIVIEFSDEGEFLEAYPARVKFRGFDTESTSRGYLNVSKYLEENISDLKREASE